MSPSFLSIRSQVTGVFCFPGVSHRGSVSRDGFLYIVQSDWRSNRSIYRSGWFSFLHGNRSGEFQVSSMFDVNLCELQVLMSQSVILALSPFAVACVVCALGNFLLPIETKGRGLLVRNKLLFALSTNFISSFIPEQTFWF